MKILFDRPVIPGLGKKYVAIDGKFIVSVTDDRPEGEFDRVICCSNRLLMPGLYNCHTHAAMTLFRGYGEELPLHRWLQERIFPAEELLTNRAVYAASMLAAVEMIGSGIVSFTDMYNFNEETVSAVLETGMKANISRAVLSFDPGADPAKDERVLEGIRLFECCHGLGDGRVRIDMSLHAEYTNQRSYCEYIAHYAKANGAGIHIHLSETEAEHKEGIERRGMTPAEFFADTGVFDVPVTAAHCVWISDSDMALMAQKGVTVAHNPASNLKLGSGIIPLEKVLSAGVNVTLGTDGTASNNRLDILREMYLAAILHKGVNRRADCIAAGDIIKMATVNGAKSQGRADCGRIEAGCRADIILLDLDTVSNIPMYEPEYTVLFSASSADVRMTMADGKVLYENGEYTTLDIEHIKHELRYVCEHYFD